MTGGKHLQTNRAGAAQGGRSVEPLVANIERHRTAAHESEALIGDDQQGGQVGPATGDEDLAFPENSFALQLTPGAAARAAYDRQIV